MFATCHRDESSNNYTPPNVQLNEAWVLLELGYAVFVISQRASNASQTALGVELALLVVVELVALNATSLDERRYIVGCPIQ